MNTGPTTDADVVTTIHYLFNKGIPPNTSAEALLAQIAGWPEDEAAVELEMEEPTERIVVFRHLLHVHQAASVGEYSLTPRLLAELTGWTHMRVERALEEAVRRGWVERELAGIDQPYAEEKPS